MKKTALTVVCNLLIAAITLGALGSCKKDKDEDKPENLIVGTWYLRNLLIKNYGGTTTADNDYTGTTYNSTFNADGTLVAYVTNWDDYSTNSTWQLLSGDTEIKLANGPYNKTYQVLEMTSSVLKIKQPLVIGNTNSTEKVWTFSKN